MDYKDCLTYAIQLLGQREYTELALRKKLQSKCDEKDTIDEVITECVDKKYCDDSRYTASYIRSTLLTKNVGPHKMLYFLKTKGITSENFWNIWKDLELDESSYLEKAFEQKKNQLKDASEYVFKTKMYTFLKRRGFSSHCIQSKLG